MITLIPVCAEDKPFLVELYASTRAAEISQWGWGQAEVDAFLSMQCNAQRRSYAMHYPTADHHLVLHQNQRVGRLIVDRRQRELLLVDLALLPSFRNQGIGTRVIQQLQQEAQDKHKSITLSVLNSNPAKRLYQRMGFIFTMHNDIYDFMEWRI